jgi:uncharacterized protein YwgA
LQKVAYLLQAAGCPFDAKFYLDVKGPYSEDVRHRIDEAVVLGLLEEEVSGPLYHENYSYRLTALAEDHVAELERSEQGRLWAAEMAPFEPLARQLLELEPKVLEVAGTLLYLKQQGRDWSQAIEKTCDSKHLPADSPMIVEAERLARAVEESVQKSAA